MPLIPSIFNHSIFQGDYSLKYQNTHKLGYYHKCWPIILYIKQQYLRRVAEVPLIKEVQKQRYLTRYGTSEIINNDYNS